MTRSIPRATRLARAALAALAAPAAAALPACSPGSPSPADAAVVDAPAPDGRLFTRLPAAYTGVRFANRLLETNEFNVFTYRNFYNGGGVAIGDLTGDGRPELVLTSNHEGPRVYLNAGAFRFRDVTRASKIEAGKGTWTTGVVLADLNGDGRLDVYVSRAGAGKPEQRANALWINEGVGPDGAPRFEDRAAEYGVADQGWSTHAAVLDYDRDGDLDLFVVNNSPRPVSGFGVFYARMTPDQYGGAKLYRNDPAPGGEWRARRFAEVTTASGVYSPENAFGLGVGVGDVNNDGWPDVYVANDFFERDYLYVNKGDGTFTEQLDAQMPVVSYFSMGMDIADVDNDGWADVYTTDMLPEDDRRLKLTGMFEGWDIYQTKVRNQYHHQLMRNMLQRNNRDGTFSDVAHVAGVARTDWSWSALIADLDLDGRKDIFVTNGLARDVTSQDYVAFLANEETMKAASNGGRSKVDFLALSKAMTTTPLPNYAFRNHGDLRFTNEAAAWGLGDPGIASGAAYGDLDGDGALDLVVNNVNGEASVYRNNARALLKDRRWLQVRLIGSGLNPFAVGARVELRAGGETQVQELSPARGFQSSVDYVLTFGLGARDTVDTLVVTWPNGVLQRATAVRANQRLTLRLADAMGAAAGAAAAARPAPPKPALPPRAGGLLARVDSATFDFAHRENAFVDFDRERLIPKMVSTEGPFMAVADVNGDGLDDAFVGGAKEQAGRLMLQRPDGRFASSNPGLFEADAISEDLGAAFFDADGDRDLDLYVVSGGNEYSEGAEPLQDRLYLNQGSGAFRKAADALPAEAASGSRVAPADFDGDGDVDLFVGGRVVPWQYGADPKSMLLMNDGRGRFADVTDRVAPGLSRVGMVTDALWRDVDADGRADLVVVGEWMPITIYRNAGGRLTRLDVPGLAKSHGWWNRVVAGDVTGDGRVDFVVGNLGLNSRLRAGAAEPAELYVKDFDGNGFAEQVLATYEGGKKYPWPLRDDLIKAIPPLKARFLNYKDYAGKTFDEAFPAEDLAGATVKTAHTFETALVRNDGGGRFTLVPLPREAQVAPVYGILAEDVDRDGTTDLLLAGNFDGFKPEIGRMAASHGLLLRGLGGGRFEPVPAARSGFFVPGQARDVQRLRTRAGALIAVTRNDDRLLLFRHDGRAAAPLVAAHPPTAR